MGFISLDLKLTEKFEVLKLQIQNWSKKSLSNDFFSSISRMPQIFV